ncbi:MAG: hypothetical protein JXC32_06905 [Anaerolineae bacterium]|nr:hypothetical protein [Anaerolineae bacterium]
MKTRMLCFALLVTLVSLAGCDGTATPAASSTPTSDPFAYCAAVGTIDAPDAAYTGPEVPESVAEGLRDALNVPETPLDVLQNGTSWRCMKGEVYACFVGANLPCEAQANTDRTPTVEAEDFCRENPEADVVPAAVTGHETVYTWRCSEGVPEVVEQVFHPDAQGFLSEFWYQISSD